jgi:hypothetical protein
MSWLASDALNRQCPWRNNELRETAKGYIRFMAINRKLWKPPFAFLPHWTCPTCQAASLSLIKDSLQIRESGPSKAAHEIDGFDPDCVIEIFTAFLECANKDCGEVVALSGRTHHVEVYDEDILHLSYQRRFEPLTFYTAPPVFPIFEVCPAEVATELRKAFALIWSDRDSCAIAYDQQWKRC